MYSIDEEMIIVPDYNNLTATVSIPFKGTMGKSKDIHLVEKKYIDKVNRTHIMEKKLCYEKARILCKFADNCCASVKSQQVKSGKLYFVFKFPNAGYLQEFETNAPYNTVTSIDYLEYLDKQPNIKR